ncbi:DNA polymerase III subunit gamma/tau [Salinibius halmophilus]|uniref:DNA polymerase III subunit gamma/tau n=1 Tax=Salinibius halmophilus TaxID=1853216 RepID=UPI000E661B29|nr:DNA polymerase III subunit gamma/tau [Salinibius halmophilus]
MSYQVLARKWRPQTFAELVGQQHVLQALVHALENNRLHHAYLFTGTRGVGKTTIARILARALNCEQGISPTPCGQCGACKEISEGRFVDLIEVDAASRTKVEDTRELLENVQYAPSKGRFKVYLIDEVHMLSTHSFNALLKTLEEPPEHVKFLFATTDPQKLPVTVLSRCLQFNLRNMTPAQVSGYLANILAKESIGHDGDALDLLANAAQGSMRDALSLTDQAIAYGRGEVRTERVVEMLGTIDRGRVVSLVERLLQQDAGQLFQQIEQIASMNPDYEQVLDETLRLLHQLALAQAVPSILRHDDKQAQLQSLLAKTSAEDIQLFYQCGLVARRDLALAPDPRIGFEMAFLRMLAFVPKLQSPERLQQINREQNSEPEIDPEPAATQTATEQAPEPVVELKAQPEAAETTAVEPDLSDDAPLEAEEAPQDIDSVVAPEALQPDSLVPEVPQAETVLTEQSPEQSPELAQSSTTETPVVTEIAEGEDSSERDAGFAAIWQTKFNRLGLQGMLESMVFDGEMRLAGNGWQLVLAPEQQEIWSGERTQALQEKLSQFLGQAPLTVAFDANRPNTPKKWQAEQAAIKKAQAIEVLQQTQFVQQLGTQFAGQLDTNTVQPSESEYV